MDAPVRSAAPLDSDAIGAARADLAPGIVREIVAACVRAPSADNCQPWRFTWDGPRLAVRHSDARGRHRLNRANAASLLALGAVIASARIAASRHGMRVIVGHGALGERGDDPWTTLAFADDARVRADPLAAQIERRCTDRRPYLGGSLAAASVGRLADEATTGVAVSALAAIDHDLLDYLLAAERSLFADGDALPETLRWVRFSRRDAVASGDGMPWRNLGMRATDMPALRLIRAAPWILPAMSACGLAALHRRSVTRAIRSSAGLVCFAVRSHDRAALVEAGAAAMRVWLRLTEAGYGVQPLSLSSLNVYVAAIGERDDPPWDGFFRAGAQRLRRAFALDAAMTPVWLFRTGVSPELPEPMRTLRRAIDDALTIVAPGDAR